MLALAACGSTPASVVDRTRADIPVRSPPHPTAGAASASSAVASAASSVSLAPACPPVQSDLPELIRTDIDVPVPPIEDSTGAVMAPFYQRVARLLRGKARDHVRIGMYGDSNLTRDFITGEMRRTLQLRHGDAGHGFIALCQPWDWYTHMDVRHGADKQGWKPIAMSTHQVLDRLYGFAGIAAQSQHRGAVTWVATAEESSPVGRAASRFDIYFLRRPASGTFDIRVDGAKLATIETDARETAAGFHAFEVEDGPHRVEIVAGRRPVRLFGLVMERSKPGIVVDSLGIGGVNAELMAKGDHATAVATLRRRGYDLVILLTGATEPDSPVHVESMERLVALHREALPGLPILIMSPPDLAGGPSKEPTRNPRIPRIARQKRQVAERSHCAFWDFRGAMGGDLSIVRFAERKMAWTDYIHLNEQGGRYMGRRFAYALWRDFMQYMERNPEAGCDEDREPVGR